MTNLIKLPTPKSIAELIENMVQQNTDKHQDINLEIHLEWDHMRIPIITFLGCFDGNKIPSLPDLMIWGAKLLKLIENLDWDTDTISWNLNVGTDHHGIPIHINKENHNHGSDDYNWIWVHLSLSDYLS